jgi:hypothetical protein
MARQKGSRSGRCQGCNYLERVRIERLLAAGASIKAAARKFAIDYRALRQHWRNHVSAAGGRGYPHNRDALFVLDTGLNTLWSANWRSTNWIRQSGSQRIIGSVNTSHREQACRPRRFACYGCNRSTRRGHVRPSVLRREHRSGVRAENRRHRRALPAAATAATRAAPISRVIWYIHVVGSVGSAGCRPPHVAICP